MTSKLKKCCSFSLQKHPFLREPAGILQDVGRENRKGKRRSVATSFMRHVISRTFFMIRKRKSLDKWRYRTFWLLIKFGLSFTRITKIDKNAFSCTQYFYLTYSLIIGCSGWEKYVKVVYHVGNKDRLWNIRVMLGLEWFFLIIPGHHNILLSDPWESEPSVRYQ